MTPSPEEIQNLEKLSRESDNWVAGTIVRLLRTDYGNDAAGFKRALDDAFSAVAELVDEAAATPPMLRVKFADENRFNSLLNQAGVVGQVWPGKVMGIPNKPSPLASMVVLGLLGAGAGNLAGRFGNYLAGGHAPGLASRATLVGGALGATPGLYAALANAHAGKHPLFGDALAVPHVNDLEKTSGFYERPQMIPVERVHDMVWTDPLVAYQLPPSIAAAASAVVEGASRIGNRQTSVPFVTPMDVGRMAVGMGGGYASGLIAGKALGALFGISDTAQQTIRQTGLAAGLLRSVIPGIFRG